MIVRKERASKNKMSEITCHNFGMFNAETGII